MRTKTIERTVQFYVIVDEQGNPLESQEWVTELSKLGSAIREKEEIDNRPYAGEIVEVPIKTEWHNSLLKFNGERDHHPANPEVDAPRMVVLAAAKDYIPNQRNNSSGKQQPMVLSGSDWDPVDNLYIWHLPFGNMIAVLAESLSSARAGRYATWLSRKLQWKTNDDRKMEFGIVPVIDESRRSLLKSADGLTSFLFTGELGSKVSTEGAGLKTIFGGGKTIPKGIRIQIKASLVRGKSDLGDQKTLLSWFGDTFGSLEGATNAQVKVVSPSGDLTEVDLINQRVTRKTHVAMSMSANRHFSDTAAGQAIIGAYLEEYQDLYRLQS